MCRSTEPLAQTSFLPKAIERLGSWFAVEGLEVLTFYEQCNFLHNFSIVSDTAGYVTCYTRILHLIDGDFPPT